MSCKKMKLGFILRRHAELVSASSRFIGGFTLIEVLVVALIIAVLTEVAVPMYQHAVIKSRFSKLMPAAKALASANEVYYLNNGFYSDTPAALDVGSDTDHLANGTHILLNDDDTVSFVRLSHDEVPHARYVMYQKNSANFADTTMCEVEGGDEKATWLCEKGLNGVIVEGGNSGNENDWVAYLLTGTPGLTDHFAITNADDPCKANQIPPEDISAGDSGATGTATCVNGKWKYTWSIGREYNGANHDGVWGEPSISCTGDSKYACAGGIFSGWRVACYGNVENACTNAIINGFQALCIGNAAYGCTQTTLSGLNARCNGNVANGCAGATLSGDKAECQANVANGCAGAILQAGASCGGSCQGVLYGAHPDKDPRVLGACNAGGASCPNGVPVTFASWSYWDDNAKVYNITGWKGGYCDASAMASGVCPNGSPTGSATNPTDKTTAAGWYGGYCDPVTSGTCPTGSPSGTYENGPDGQCWDGSGNRVTC